MVMKQRRESAEQTKKRLFWAVAAGPSPQGKMAKTPRGAGPCGVFKKCKESVFAKANGGAGGI